ncbi:MAG: MFS transporter [Polaromonas sp.]|nr:MFS transporter [Polaromonas sp.]
MTIPVHTDLQPDSGRLDRKSAALVFLAFAAAYFCSALVRAITATLSPALSLDFNLKASDLGLLAGGYFFGFAAMQLPLGRWLDRYGPKRVILYFLSFAVVGCVAFSMASSFAWLLAARVLVGMGVSACLMAPLTGFRRWLSGPTLVRANSWMLMTGSFGMLASTLPVQWLMPLTGWRPLFWLLAILILLCMAVIARVVPPTPVAPVTVTAEANPASYAQVWRSRYFQAMTPLAFFNYGGLIAIQTLWAGPWMVRVAGYTPLESATGLFYLNACMLVTFWCWGMLAPWLIRQGWNIERLIVWGVPVSLLVLAVNIAGGSATGWVGWTIFCMTSSILGSAQPAIGMAFKPSLVGRALSAYNLMIFSGVFCVQWSIGLLIDAFKAVGMPEIVSFQAAMGVFLCCCIASYAWFIRGKADNSGQ